MREERLAHYFVCLMVWAIYLGILLACINATASTTGDAIETAIKAAYEQSGVKDDVEAYGKKMEKLYIKKEHEKFWAALVYVADSLIHYEIKIKVTF